MKRIRWKPLLLSFVFVLLILLTWKLSTVLTAEELQALLGDLGTAAPLAYLALWVLLPTFFFPVAVLVLAGGLLFGLFWGSVYTFIGAILNCSLMFWMARSVGHRQVKALVQRKLSPLWQQRLQQAGGKQGYLLLILLRLIPAVPYNLINYSFGLTDIRFGSYLAASALGIIPGTLAFINIGDKALDSGSPDFWLAIALLLLLLLVTTLLGKKLLSADKSSPKAQEQKTEADRTGKR